MRDIVNRWAEPGDWLYHLDESIVMQSHWGPSQTS